MWLCSKCEEHKAESEFHLDNRPGRKRPVQSACKNCTKARDASAERKAQRREANRRHRGSEEGREYYRKYHAARKDDPEYQEHRRKSRVASRRKAKYGLPKGAFEILVDQQRGICLLCRGYSGLKLRIDHCHNTGEDCSVQIATPVLGCCKSRPRFLKLRSNI